MLTPQRRALDYLGRRRAMLEARIERMEESDNWDADDIEPLYEEFVEVDDLIHDLAGVTVSDELAGEQRRVGFRRSGVTDRLRPLIERLMRDGRWRTVREVLEEFPDEPEHSVTAVQLILSHDRHLYQRDDREQPHRYRMLNVTTRTKP